MIQKKMFASLRRLVERATLTFDRSGGKLTEETDGHFQNVCLLKLGVASVVFADQRQDQAFQVAETVVDTSASALLQQGFKSLEGNKENTC